jgi:DNA end-binding protein Ku
MASTVWKGQLTFGLVSFPVRLLRAARKERTALKYVKETRPEVPEETEFVDLGHRAEEGPGDTAVNSAPPPAAIVPVQGYFFEGQREPSSAADLQRGYEVAPDRFVVVRPEELKALRKATSPDMQIVRSVKLPEIDPLFFETSYYVVPGASGEHAYALFYRALSETQLAALAQVAMHGREHVVVIRTGAKGLIAHTMFYVNEVRGAEEYAADTTDVAGKELDLAKKFIEALVEPFRPEEFTDRYREQLQALIAAKDMTQPLAAAAGATKANAKVVDIMDALRQSLQTATVTRAERKPAESEPAVERKARKRKA